MKKDLRIVFMGTPDFAVASLKALIDNKFNIVGVVTASDKPAGRGQKIMQSAVKQFAEAEGLHVLQPNNLKSDAFIKELKLLEVNLQIVVAFRMLPKVVWQLPEYGTFNLHASLLPNYRGAAPINWAIINGEKTTGVSTFFIDEQIDTGALISQKEITISPNETAGDLHDKLKDIGGDLVVESTKFIERGNVKTTPQKTIKNIKSAPKLTKENCKIDWNDSLNNIYNKVRGLNPHPAAWCLIRNYTEELNVKVYEVEKCLEKHNLENGSILIVNNDFKVAVANGFIKLKEIKIPGKRKMDVKSLLNGYSFGSESKML